MTGAKGPSGTLGPILTIVVAAAIGMVPSLAAKREMTPVRWISLVPNGAVLLFYGFLLLFFGLGGSR